MEALQKCPPDYEAVLEDFQRVRRNLVVVDGRSPSGDTIEKFFDIMILEMEANMSNVRGWTEVAANLAAATDLYR